MTSDLGPQLSEHELCPSDLLAGQEAALARDIERIQARKDEFVVVSCPACSKRHENEAFEKFGFRFVRCGLCRTLYMSPRPSPELIAAYYANSENYAYWAKQIFPASEASRRDKVQAPWLQRVLIYCAENGMSNGRMIEVGPGFGTFAALAVASGQFTEVVVIEPTPELAAACRQRGLSVIEKRIEEISESIVPPAEVLCAFEVIEHLFDPADFLQRCGKLVRPGGLIVLSCPNGLGFDIVTLGAKSLAVDNEHVNLFNPASLGALLERLGFNVIEANTPGRLDAEFVRNAVLKGEINLSEQPFLERILIGEWDRLGWPFQQFLASNGLSSHMWLVARRG